MLRRLRRRVASLFRTDSEQNVIRAADALEEMIADFEKEQGDEALQDCLRGNNSLGEMMETLEENSSLSADDYDFPEGYEEDSVAFDPSFAEEE